MTTADRLDKAIEKVDSLGPPIVITNPRLPKWIVAAISITIVLTITLFLFIGNIMIDSLQASAGRQQTLAMQITETQRSLDCVIDANGRLQAVAAKLTASFVNPDSGLDPVVLRESVKELTLASDALPGEIDRC